MSRVAERLGRKIFFYRKLAGLTQDELAERVGVVTETIGRLERGVAIPSISRIEDVARVLGVELPDLFLFRESETARDRAMDRLKTLLAGRGAEDIDLVHDLAARIFSQEQPEMMKVAEDDDQRAG